MIEIPQLWLPDRLRQRREDERLMRQAGLGWQRRWMPQNPCCCGKTCDVCANSKAPNNMQVDIAGVTYAGGEFDECIPIFELINDSFVLQWKQAYTAGSGDSNCGTDPGKVCEYQYLLELEDATYDPSYKYFQLDITIKLIKETVSGEYHICTKIAAIYSTEPSGAGWSGFCTKTAFGLQFEAAPECKAFSSLSLARRYELASYLDFSAATVEVTSL